MIKERLQFSDLRALQVLQDFSAAQLNQLSRNMTVLNVRKGEVIYRPGRGGRESLFGTGWGDWSVSFGKQGKRSPLGSVSSR